MAHPNEDLLRRGYDAFGSGDMDTLRELMAPDVVWHVAGRSPMAGDYKGIEEVLGFFGKSMELSGGTTRVEVHDILANDEHGVALVRFTGQREGRSNADNGVQVFHIRDGKATEVWTHPGDQYAVDEFWS